MKRLYLQHLILSAILVLTLGACVHNPTKTMQSVASVETASPHSQYTVLLQEARVESENLRAELASLKILMAKQLGELQSLRNQSKSVHHREQGQGQELQNIRSQLLSSQAERDQLRKTNMELQGQVASMHQTSQLVSDIQVLHGTFQEVMGKLNGLTSDITLIKQEMHVTKNMATPQHTTLTTKSTRAKTHKQAPDTKGRVLIQYGDTLWKLARTYQVSVDQLKEWNHMTSDSIMSGFPLKVVEPAEEKGSHEQHVKPTTERPTPTVKHESLDAPVQMTTHQSGKTPEGNPTEPTHILSIASPQVDSHESP